MTENVSASSSIISATVVSPSQHSQVAPATALNRCTIDACTSNSTASPSNTASSTSSMPRGRSSSVNVPAEPLGRSSFMAATGCRRRPEVNDSRRRRRAATRGTRASSRGRRRRCPTTRAPPGWSGRRSAGRRGARRGRRTRRRGRAWWASRWRCDPAPAPIR